MSISSIKNISYLCLVICSVIIHSSVKADESVMDITVPQKIQYTNITPQSENIYKETLNKERWTIPATYTNTTEDSEDEVYTDKKGSSIMEYGNPASATITNDTVKSYDSVAKETIVTKWVDPVDDPEFKEALAWMYSNRLTDFKNSSEYRPFDKITRSEAAKIIGRFTQYVLSTKDLKQRVVNDKDCFFKDFDTVYDSLKADVAVSCQLGLFNGDSGYFYPHNTLSKAQSIAVLIRLFDNKIYDESGNPRFGWYLSRAIDLWISSNSNIDNYKQAVTRYEIAIMIYRFQIKYKLLNKEKEQFSNNSLINVVKEIPADINVLWSTGITWWDVKLLTTINSNKLTDKSTDNISMNIFNSAFQIRKRKIDTYGIENNNFIRFGDLIDTKSERTLWTVSFVIIWWSIYEAYIRPDNKDFYYIILPSEQPPYYEISKKWL